MKTTEPTKTHASMGSQTAPKGHRPTQTKYILKLSEAQTAFTKAHPSKNAPEEHIGSMP